MPSLCAFENAQTLFSIPTTTAADNFSGYFPTSHGTSTWDPLLQNEMDWLSNRHGLILSLKDGANRHYQVWRKSTIMAITFEVCFESWPGRTVFGATYYIDFVPPKHSASRSSTPSSAERHHAVSFEATHAFFAGVSLPAGGGNH